MEGVAARDLVRELRRCRRGDRVEHLVAPRSRHLRCERARGRGQDLSGCGSLEKPTLQDRGKVRVVVDRRRLAVADQQGVELVAALLARAVEVHVVLLRRDHHDDGSDVGDVVDAVEQRPEKCHVAHGEVSVLGVGELPDVVHDLVDEDEHGASDGSERLDDLALVTVEVLVPQVQRVVAAEQPPQEPLVQRPRRSVVCGDALPGGHVVARQHHDLRIAEVRCGRAIEDRCRLGKCLAPRVGRREHGGVGGKVPQSDEAVRLAAAHRLVQSPQCPRPGVVLATAEPDRDLGHEVGEQRAGVGDLAVVGRVGIGGTVSDGPVDRLEQRHLHVVDGAGRVRDLVAELEYLPPGGHRRAHEDSFAITGVLGLVQVHAASRSRRPASSCRRGCPAGSWLPAGRRLPVAPRRRHA